MPSSYDIEINKPCLIPEMYIDDIYMRLKYYRMISSCKDENELEELLFTIQDIYGPVPEELNNLLIISLMKQKLSDKNIQRLKIYNDSVTIQLNKKSVLKFNFSFVPSGPIISIVYSVTNLVFPVILKSASFKFNVISFIEDKVWNL